MPTRNILFVGIGGQGVMLASELLALVAAAAGYDVKQTEVHGVAQRGGAVASHVRYGDKVYSPTVRRGEADLLVAFEKLEALRWAHYLKPNGLLVLNDEEVLPTILNPSAKYPQDAIAFLQSKPLRLVTLSATRKAVAMGNVRVASAIMLGAVSHFLTDLGEAAWEKVMRERIPERLLSINQEAFALGKSLVQSLASE